MMVITGRVNGSIFIGTSVNKRLVVLIHNGNAARKVDRALLIALIVVLVLLII